VFVQVLGVCVEHDGIGFDSSNEIVSSRAETQGKSTGAAAYVEITRGGLPRFARA
jgi:hypothetical protein